MLAKLQSFIRFVAIFGKKYGSLGPKIVRRKKIDKIRNTENIYSHFPNSYYKDPKFNIPEKITNMTQEVQFNFVLLFLSYFDVQIANPKLNSLDVKKCLTNMTK